jgi:hypothetical protein
MTTAMTMTPATRRTMRRSAFFRLCIGDFRNTGRDAWCRQVRQHLDNTLIGPGAVQPAERRA